MLFKASVATALLAAAGLTTAVTFSDADASYHALQQWYNHSIGLWIPSTGWWNSANALTTIADLAAIDDSIKAQSRSVFQNTFVKAQEYNLQMQKTVGSGYLPWTYYGRSFLSSLGLARNAHWYRQSLAVLSPWLASAAVPSDEWLPEQLL
jgi:hypothetical protein